MEPMKPMQPMKPMDAGPAWWPDDLGDPASSGGQDGVRYAFFPDRRRLAVERDGAVAVYDSGDHRITGVSQAGGGGALTLAGRHGEVALDQLRRLG